ncbi:MAG: DUF2235 domain-containing protein [Acidobacteria bacterium]|nr:DUF2235 domain-containing protein [Acidobacteriota bacterium]MCL5286497.1 DUF2235 domain-containing protein [Acidobacteriota bacterium]MCL5287782.1 DUF2235 domain-containing protein [Acidobacteriota bacterium]
MKRLVVCCDGTWNKPDQPHPTNVVKVATTLLQSDSAGVTQLLFYDPGVGTGALDRIRGGAFGVGLSKNIQQAYHFLVFNYMPGDELYFFGFSRGAYTARSAVGLIRNSGLLKREHLGKSEQAYQLYRRRDKDSGPAEKEATQFKKDFAFEPPIKFVGVWDTVGALGVPLSFVSKFWEFHDPRLSRSVQYAYHALALDERRKPFRPTLWEQHPEAPATQVLEQVWFAGVHTNVGGGYPDSGLSDIALLWMVNKAEACGLAFDRPRLNAMVKPDLRGKIENSQRWFYWLMGGNFLRPVGKATKSNETAASSAADRLADKSTKYDAKNLSSFLSASGKKTPVP